MKKNYVYTFLFILFLTTFSFAQDSKLQPKSNDNIEGLSIYPNPVSTGKIYIISKSGEDKEVTVFDVLGKKVIQTTITSKELILGIKKNGEQHFEKTIELRKGRYINIENFKLRQPDSTIVRKIRIVQYKKRPVSE